MPIFTSQKIQSFSITKTSRPNVLREIIYIYLDNNMKPKYNMWQNTMFFNDTAGVPTFIAGLQMINHPYKTQH